MGMLTVRLPDDVHERWKVFCSSQGLKPSSAVRQAIEGQVQAEVTPMKPTGSGGKKKIKIYIRITESEREGIRLRTHLEGGTRSGWIAKVIRSALTKAPMLGAEQTEAVKKSNHLLLKMGVNINQMARRLNEHPGAQNHAVELAELQAIRQQIDAHVAEMQTLISTVSERGELRPG